MPGHEPTNDRRDDGSRSGETDAADNTARNDARAKIRARMELDAPRNAQKLDVALRGSLPCIVCGYELQGLSIRGSCPECGTFVRATILHRVDPSAAPFVPLHTPRLLAVGIIVWIAGAGVTVGAGWLRRIGEWADRIFAARDPREWLTTIAIVGLVASAAGAATLLRPTRKTAWWKTAAGGVALLAYLPMLWAIARLGSLDAQRAHTLFSATVDGQRESARLVLSLSVVAACLGLRFAARDLAKRCLALRTRRVDRQTLLAIGLAAAAGAVGDALRLGVARGAFGADPDTNLAINSAGGVLVAISAIFVTLGLAGAFADALRIAGALRRPAPRIDDLIDR